MNVSELLKKAAPWLAAAASGPAGIAAVAIKTIAEALGAQPDSTSSDGAPSWNMDTVTAAITGATPEQLKALKLADLDFKVRMQELGFKHETDLLKIAADNTSSARTAAVAGGTSKHLFWMSVILLAICIGAEIAVLFNGVPPNADPLVVGRVLGLLDAVALIVMNFNYGSTGGSQRKTELLAAAEPIKK